MSYSRGIGAAITTKAPALVMSPTLIKASVPTATPAPYRGLPTAAKIASDAAKAAAEAARPGSIVSAECEDYKYAVTYKTVPRRGVVRAGTPIVAGRKIKWTPTTAGADFPQSWVTWRNSNARLEQVELDARTQISSRGPSLPANSTAYLTSATRAFLLGYSMLGDNVAILYVGAVSTKDVDMQEMQYYLNELLKTQNRVTTFPIAYGIVPLKNPAESPSSLTRTNEVAYPDRIGSKYSINSARQTAVGAAISMTEALQVLISGEIFGSIAVAGSQTLFIPGEREVLAAIAALDRVPSLAGVPSSLQSLTATLIQEALAAKSLEPTEGDRICADIIGRLNAMQSSVLGELNAGLSALSAGAAALAGAQAAASTYVNNAHSAEAEIKRKVAEKIALHESKTSFTSLTPGEQFAVHCIMVNKAAPLIAARTAVAEPRAAAMTAISPSEFGAQVAAGTFAYEQAIAQSSALFADAIAQVEAVRAQIALDWYARDLHGLPVWAWGAGGAVALLGGALAIRHFQNK